MARRPVKVIKSEEPAMSIQPKLDSSQAVSAFRRSIHWCMAVSLRDLPFIRKTLISLAVILSISGFTVALAQHQTNTRPVRVPAVPFGSDTPESEDGPTQSCARARLMSASKGKATVG
jgi:hypothetical protein